VWESEKSGYATGTPVYVESDPVWVADKAGYYTQVESDGLYATGTPIYVEADPVWESEKSGYATGTPLYVYSETDPVWEAEKAGYATGTPLYVESYVGTITGGTIVTGETASVTTNAGSLDFVVPSGGGGAGTFTNMLSSDGSIDWTNPEGPQPDGSVTSYVEGVAAGYVATNATDYTGLLTNLLAFHGESGVVMRAYGDTNVAFGAPDLATKATVTIVSNAFGTADAAVGLGASNYADTVGAAVGLGATNYGLAIGLGASNYADSVGTVVSNAYTNTAVLAAAALPKAGGTMTGALTNEVAYWLPVNGTVYFGTATNYIVDQNGTNFLFMSGTNSANFGW